MAFDGTGDPGGDSGHGDGPWPKVCKFAAALATECGRLADKIIAAREGAGG